MDIIQIGTYTGILPIKTKIENNFNLTQVLSETGPDLAH